MKTTKLKDFFGKALFKEIKALKLKPKHILFISYYINNGLNASQAYREAGFGSKKQSTAAVAVGAHKLITQANIKAAIRLMMDAWLDAQKLKLDRQIIDVLTKRAFYDPKMFIKDDGSPAFEKLEDLPEEWRCVIDGIETKCFGKDADVVKTVVKLANREVSMDKLSKYIILFKEQPQSLSLGLTDEAVNKLEGVFRKAAESQPI